MKYLLAVLLATVAVCSADDGTRILGAGRIAADARDTEGETVGGIGSAMEMTPRGVVMLSDRGAGDGLIDFRPRLQFFNLERDGGVLKLTPVRTTILRDPNGHPFTGLFPDRPAATPPQRADGRLCLDPEGLAIGQDGHFFISEEYEPAVLEFDANGYCVRRFETPEECVPQTKAGTDFANNSEKDVIAGRQPNRGFEGLALLPDGRLAAILQGGLAQDGGRKAGFTRLFLFDTSTGKPTAAYRVPFPQADDLNAICPKGRELKPKHFVISDLTALPDGRLLALERDNFGADGSAEHGPARYKAVVLLDLAGAENILGHADAASAAPVGRTLLFNLAALDTDAAGLAREELPAKWEGLAISNLEGGRLRVLLSSDNDFLTPQLFLWDEAAKKTHPVIFPRAQKPQDTWVLEVETILPPPRPISSGASNQQNTPHEK